MKISKANTQVANARHVARAMPSAAIAVADAVLLLIPELPRPRSGVSQLQLWIRVIFRLKCVSVLFTLSYRDPDSRVRGVTSHGQAGNV